MNLFNQYYSEILESLRDSQDSGEVTPHEMALNGFIRVLNERDTFRTDSTSKKVRIPVGYSYKQGPDGVGIAVGPCDEVKQDRVGRIHAVPKGYVLHIGLNGKGVVLPKGDGVRTTKEGQIEPLFQPAPP